MSAVHLRILALNSLLQCEQIREDKTSVILSTMFMIYWGGKCYLESCHVVPFQLYSYLYTIVK